MALLPINASGQVDLSEGRSVRPPRSDARHVGLRSHAVRIQRDDAAAEGVVNLVERVGASTLADIDLGSLTVAARLSDDSKVHVGERVPVAFDWDEACFFDSDGKRLDKTPMGSC
jgi:ABC-type sugar transport system ATPase subunit